MKETRAEVRITGRVQGVGFRYFLHRTAAGLGLRGYVRNTVDGAVEAVFEGKEPDVKKIVSACSEGPPGASVEKADVEYKNPGGGFRGFEISQ